MPTQNSITIHSLDDELNTALRKYASETETSLNKAIKKLLAQALNLTKTKKKHDFSEFVGTLSDEDFQAMQKTLKEVRKVHPGDWQL